jgi:hypothetical protein
MQASRWAVSFVLASIVTAGCVAPSGSEDRAPSDASTPAGMSAPPSASSSPGLTSTMTATRVDPTGTDAALATWFEAEICPNGAAVERVDTRTGERRVVPCEDVLAKLMADDDGRAALLDLYQQRNQPRLNGEPIAEARQRWSPFGFACSLLMASAALAFNPPGAKFGCNDPNANDKDACTKVTSWGFAGLGLLCCLI